MKHTRTSASTLTTLQVRWDQEGYESSVHYRAVVVAFRGSHSIKSFIIDLQSATLIPYKNVTGASVGLGFYKEWIDLSTQVMPEVKKLLQQHPSYSVWVTGHSLGGALATLCALDLQTDLHINATVYTYGSPRVGNVAFAQYYNSLVPNTFRIVNEIGRAHV